MVSFETRKRLQQIAQEDDSRDKISKFLLPKPTIKATSELTKPDFKTSKTLKTFRKSNFLVYGAILLISILWFAIFFAIAKQKNINQLGLGFTMFMLFFFTINAIYQLFYSDEYNFTIYIDNNGIQVDDKLFPWSQIQETAILIYRGKGGETGKLIILLIDNDYWKFDLTNFYSIWGISKSVSNYIEYFKPTNSPNSRFAAIGG